MAPLRGIGHSTVSIHPAEALEQIATGIAKGIAARQPPQAMPEHFKLDVRFRSHINAYRFSFYPGAEAIADDTVRFETDSFFDILRAIQFAR